MDGKIMSNVKCQISNLRSPSDDCKKAISNKPYAISKKVLVAMSGGVDSSVVAAMLKKQGHDVIGVFLKFWSPPKDKNCKIKENICCNQEALRSARSVAAKLKIPFYVFDVGKEFKREVVDYYVNEYDFGRTPNPCVVCNKKIKFGWLLEKAKKLGCRYIATGHYAKIGNSRAESQKGGHFFSRIASFRKSACRPTFYDSACLYKPKDTKKDQTYFLWQLNQEQLQHILFPLGSYTKAEVRKLAQEWELPTTQKKESQNVCFVPDGNNAGFLSTYAKKLTEAGNIVDKAGNILGKHEGLYKYTIGQRKGLPQLVLSDKRMANSKHRIPPLYVIKLNIGKNELVVGEKEDLFSRELIAEKINWIAGKPPKFSFIYKAKIRYGHSAERCKVYRGNDMKEIKVVFDKPQQAITPGQSVVFYLPLRQAGKNKDELMGGGTIK